MSVRDDRLTKLEFLNEFDRLATLDASGHYEFFLNGAKELLRIVQTRGLTSNQVAVEVFIREDLLEIKRNPTYPVLTLQEFRQQLIDIIRGN